MYRRKQRRKSRTRKEIIIFRKHDYCLKRTPPKNSLNENSFIETFKKLSMSANEDATDYSVKIVIYWKKNI